MMSTNWGSHQYQGYYVDTMGIDDIEKYILEKNKRKYKMGGK